MADSDPIGTQLHSDYEGGFRRLVALGLITSVALTGCARAGHYDHPALRDRSSQIASIAAVIVDVRVYSLGLGGGIFSGEWSETARNSLRSAVAKHFGGDLRFAVKEFNPKAEATQQELEQVLNVMEEIVAARVKEGVACLPGPTLALADAAGTDALLLVYARDRIMTGGFRAAIAALIVATVGFFAVFLAVRHNPLGPGEFSEGEYRVGGLNTIALCLVDPRKGDALWLDLQAIGTGSLLDASYVERLIGGAYAKLGEAAHQ